MSSSSRIFKPAFFITLTLSSLTHTNFICKKYFYNIGSVTLLGKKNVKKMKMLGVCVPNTSFSSSLVQVLNPAMCVPCLRWPCLYSVLHGQTIQHATLCVDLHLLLLLAAWFCLSCERSLPIYGNYFVSILLDILL